MNEQSLQTNIEGFRELIQLKGWSVVTEKEVPSGYQIIVTDGVTRNPVSFYLTGKILIQGKAGILQTELQLWMQERSTTPFRPTPLVGFQLPSAPTNVSHTARFYVSLNHIDQVKELLLGFSTQVTIQELSLDPYQVYRIDIYQGNQRMVATQYKSGTLLIQGRTSELFEDICRVLENTLSHSFAERGASYVPDSERDVILEHMNRPQTERKALDWVYALAFLQWLRK